MPGLTRSVYTMPLANHRDDEHGEESAAGAPSYHFAYHLTVPLTPIFPAFPSTFLQCDSPCISSPSS